MATNFFQIQSQATFLYGVLDDYLSKEEIQLVKKAYKIADKAHSGQYRKSGESYISHPLSVALILAELKLDYLCIVAAILHDCIEDTSVTNEDVKSEFGEEVAHIVEGVSKLTSLEFTSSSQKQAQNFQKLILAMSKDMRVMIIKLADRLHNMRTIGSMSEEKRIQKAKETSELHAPIARRLGLHSIGVELDDLCFQTLHPRKHLVIKRKINKQYGNQKKTISLIKTEIENRLKFEQIIASVEGRQKEPSSIYNKMKIKSRKFSEVLDMHAFRIVVENTNACYQALGHIHSLYKPIPLKFKDYISAPKPNGYQSLHTVLIGPRKMFIEVQIRSQEMDFISEYGIAAHWHYKNTDKPSKKLARNWMGSLLDIQQNTDTSVDFLESTKSDLFSDEVFVFTPGGKIIQLPLRATVLDFAYAVHTNIGKKAQKATINGNEVELSTPLKSGQTVEIIIGRFVKPKPSWLDIVVTSKAKTAIKAHLKDNSKVELARLGKLLISDALKFQNIKINDVPLVKWNKCFKELNCVDFNDLYIRVGLSEIFVAVVVNKLLQDINNETINTISIGQTKGMAINFAHCCFPIPGDEVTGVLTSQKGLVLHRSNCSNLEHIKEKNAQWMEVDWKSDGKEEFEVAISCLVENRSGRLAAIANILANLGVNIENIEQQQRPGSNRLFYITLGVSSVIELNSVLDKLNNLPHLISVSRL
ncbi:bifunctional (p)ppGpp synthetase/guanosine-3',5'-bis(diphosphate) 3'-pyrophosphohydrolase [Candidatus Pseudothioglobus singularis]|nr:bifunctional (p)ppGpp synthetase/guanosine-3',5'-bis(diphosphate) 3'-pyrophosphohydrolase [Candidatus Pseudothioglobus singularis]